MINFRARAVDMAHIQARYLLRIAGSAQPERMVPQAVLLVHDCVYHLELPSLAVDLVLGLHALAERWSIWSAWDAALALVLGLEPHHLTVSIRIRLLIHRSHTARMLGDRQTAGAAASEALELAEIEQNPELTAEAHNCIGLNAFFHDELITAQAHWDLAYAQGSDHLPALMLGHIRMNLGTVAMHGGDLPAARRHLQTACELYQAAGEPVARGKAQCNLAELLRRSGEPEAALPMLLEAQSIFQAAEARYDLGLVQNDIGCVYLSLRRWDLALQSLTAAVSEFEHIGSLYGKAWVLPNIGELYVSTQQWQNAERTLDEARELALLCDRPLIVAAVDVDRGRMLAAGGAHPEALHVWEGALRIQEAKGAHLAAEQTRQLIQTLGTEATR